MATPTDTVVTLRSPSTHAPIPPTAVPPQLPWLLRPWTVTHSTLPMWRLSRNVRISYRALPSDSSSRERNADRVEHVPISADGSDGLSLCERITAAPRVIEGVNTAVRPGDAGSWNWRGKGALFFVTSHWEILGWGERRLPGGDVGGIDGGGDGDGDDEGSVERWAVTWFQKTLFSDEGVDIYCDRVEGLSEETHGLIREALGGLEAKHVVDLVEKDMQPVKITI